MGRWYIENREQILARQKHRYHTDESHRAKSVADAKRWYRDHRAEVLARLQAQRDAAKSASGEPG